ncbi:bifunctional 4-hydroxy-2-oxoglutarate aldolase/2-dehydro-3-deoxy-phosphogluconate aldolase [soil metagenome]
MNRTAILERILAAGIVAVVRYPEPDPLVDVIAALADGGITVSEVTMTVPNALGVIRDATTRLGERVLLGAGTILTVEMAKQAVAAGAKFIVSPTLNVDVIKWCNTNDVPVMPGAFTPTEVLAAWDAGADIVKVFPAEILGPAFFKALRGPLPHVKLMPTGGVDLTTAKSFLDAGAVCLGVGSQLVDPKLIAAGDFTALRERARHYYGILQASPGRQRQE